VSARPAAVESLESRQLMSSTVVAPTWQVEQDPTAPAGAAEQLGGEQTLNLKIDDIKSTSSRNIKGELFARNIKGELFPRNLKIDVFARNIKIDVFAQTGGDGFDSAKAR
jgi:hypothetical protein